MSFRPGTIDNTIQYYDNRVLRILYMTYSEGNDVASTSDSKFMFKIYSGA